MSAPASVPVGVQLYSLREQAAADFPAVLERSGGEGIRRRGVRGLLRLAAEQVRRALDEAGLRSPSAHVGLAEADEFARRARRASPLGCDTVVIPAAFEPGFADLDKVKRNRRPRQRGRTRSPAPAA